MKAVWVNPLNGSWPDWAKFRKYGLTRLYVDARELKKDGTNRLKELVDGIHSQGFEAGLYRDPSWTSLTAAQLAAQASKDLTAAGITSKDQQCAYLFDVEYHDPKYLLDLITAWKKPRPTREWAWTMEPFQGGWWTPELVSRINADEFCKVAPQLYLGTPPMYPCSELAVMRDLPGALRVDRSWFFYDGILGAPQGMDGIVFTDTRLPT